MNQEDKERAIKEAFGNVTNDELFESVKEMRSLGHRSSRVDDAIRLMKVAVNRLVIERDVLNENLFRIGLKAHSFMEHFEAGEINETDAIMLIRNLDAELTEDRLKMDTDIEKALEENTSKLEGLMFMIFREDCLDAIMASSRRVGAGKIDQEILIPRSRLVELSKAVRLKTDSLAGFLPQDVLEERVNGALILGRKIVVTDHVGILAREVQQ